MAAYVQKGQLFEEIQGASVKEHRKYINGGELFYSYLSPRGAAAVRSSSKICLHKLALATNDTHN